jgi:hypothetical protein
VGVGPDRCHHGLAAVVLPSQEVDLIRGAVRRSVCPVRSCRACATHALCVVQQGEEWRCSNRWC